jgi:hypothetical protein
VQLAGAGVAEVGAVIAVEIGEAYGAAGQGGERARRLRR